MVFGHTCNASFVQALFSKGLAGTINAAKRPAHEVNVYYLFTPFNKQRAENYNNGNSIKKGIHVSFNCFKRLKLLSSSCPKINIRAQRALGRSPEEKVKGHSGAIYKGPLMLSTKNW